METITLKYNSGAQSRGYYVKWVRGLDDPDDTAAHPGKNQVLGDGSVRETNTRFNRKITIVFFEMSLIDDEAFIVLWSMDRTKQIVYGSETISVILDPSMTTLVFSWLGNADRSRGLTLPLIEKTAQSAAPASWS